MSTLSIVALSVCGALFVLLLLASAGIIVYLQLQLRHQISLAMDAQRLHRQAMVELFSDSQSSLGLLAKDIGATLESHRSQMDEKIGRVNGEELAAAAKLSASSAQRIERAAIAIGDLCRALLSEEALGGAGVARAAAAGLGPEDYAPPSPGERYAGINRTAQGDAEVLAAEFSDDQT